MTGSDEAAFILLVEDNERNARLFTEILLANGYRLSVARDGKECLNTVKRQLPNLILMDLQLPGIDGLTVIRHLREDSRTSEIPIIALTAHAMPEHRERFLAAGCCAYITKPISYRPFLDEIDRVLREHSGNRSMEVTHACS
jgi:two-component system cell cycle response regulator DivK